ncbi:TonB [Tritrichomonas foetus]|uniref:TonB n=1 Tax=Tritrichomonas foetus TaxID=1144522 RepID=A0A1J4J8X3_9EUKA|nr:TonB [Tritrichomonas foetus]|eukprot:OHS95137.1 TonB [Tritrichomonas foetus]
MLNEHRNFVFFINIMEAKLRYRKEIQSGGVKKGLGSQTKQKKSNTQTKEEINNVDITHSAPKEIPKAFGAPRIDFVQRNIDQANEQKSRAKEDKVPNRKERIVNKKHAPGEIPDYYAQRAAEQEARNYVPDEPKCPPGMRILTEREKYEALNDLTEQKEEIEKTLGKAPLRIESPQLLRQQRMLEQQLTDIEASLEQLKKKYVFVPE